MVPVQYIKFHRMRSFEVPVLSLKICCFESSLDSMVFSIISTAKINKPFGVKIGIRADGQNTCRIDWLVWITNRLWWPGLQIRSKYRPWVLSIGYN
eukprot:s1201_g12.t1